MHRYSYYQPVAYVTNIDCLSQAYIGYAVNARNQFLEKFIVSFRAICFRLKFNRTVYPMRAVFFHKTFLQSECSCILGLPADDTGSLP